MCEKIESTLGFVPELAESKNAMALIFDLEGFSSFYNQPDIQDYVLHYLNQVFDALSVCIYGGEAYWLDWPERNLQPLPLSPIHEKFLGDGALYLWSPDDKEKSFPNVFITNLANRLWDLKKYFIKVNEKCADLVPIAERPERIRFGLARGNIYEIKTKKGEGKEYIGFCINLASRLQSYCPDLGFIASARIGLAQEGLRKHGYIKAIAKSIKGFPREEVIVDKYEFQSLSSNIMNEKFEKISHAPAPDRL